MHYYKIHPPEQDWNSIRVINIGNFVPVYYLLRHKVSQPPRNKRLLKFYQF